MTSNAPFLGVKGVLSAMFKGVDDANIVCKELIDCGDHVIDIGVYVMSGKNKEVVEKGK